MGFLVQLATFLVTVALSSGSLVKTPTNGPNFELLILHNNDMHARFEQTSQLSGACTIDDRNAGKCYGGFPRVAYVVKEARQAAATGQGPPVLYLNAGDTYTGTAWFTIYKWKIAAEFINALQPDAVSLGNNEFENGLEELSPFLNNLQTKILASNVILKSAENNEKFQKSFIFDVKGTNVGIIGYLTPEANILDSTGNIEYIDEVIALKDEVSKLKEKNVSIIIALGHGDVNKDIEIAKEVEDIDLVIGGHKNTFFWNGTSKEFPISESIVVNQLSGRQVPVIQSSAYNKYLGKIHIKFDNDGEIIEHVVNPILLNEKIPQDPEAVEIIKNYDKEISLTSTTIIGNTSVVLDGNSCKVEECNLGNLITDAIMYYYAVRYEGTTWTDAAIAVIHGGAISASIAPSNRPAPVTYSELLSALPLESNIVIVNVTGTILNQILEHAVSNYSIKNPTGQFLQFSGIRIVYDLSREPGSRIVSSVVRCWSCTVPEYYVIEDGRYYKMLMPVALANGQFGYSMLASLPREYPLFDEVTSTAEYFALRSPVYPEVAGRIVLRNLDAIEDIDDVPDSATSLHCTLLLFVLSMCFVMY